MVFRSARAQPAAAAAEYEELARWVPADRLILDPSELRVYECDGLPLHKEPPGAVVLCASREEVIGVVRWCHERRIPFVPRGAGTGLSGGATPVPRGVVIDLNRMRRILKVDVENRYAVVEPGTINMRVTQAVEAQGYHYAPDPSSQKACTIAGNVAENSGGPHCLKYGMTTDHVLGIEVVLPDGEVARLGGPLAEPPGYDLVGLFVGTEGTFGVVTEVTVRLTPSPQSVRTYLAVFDDMSLACRTVAEITRQGILPAALEILDRLTIQAVEASVFRAGYPQDAAAVLLVELDGFEAGMDEDEEKIRRIALENRAIELKAARDAAQRMQLWKGRKGAFGAMGRINTDLYVLDGVVPRTRLEETLNEVYGIARKHRVTVSNVFHAGDGNLHPNISYDGRDPEETARVLAAGREILEACVRAGGSISGEHGIGVEKVDFMPLLFGPDDIQLQKDLRLAVDPLELSNPGKIFPDSRSCIEVGKRRWKEIPL
ncbi:MAG: FAD-binding protein [Planctomycetes bacterium]|nr:FAD-binding protein [Planctomycetota bacterium]